MLSEILKFRSRVIGVIAALALCLLVPALRAQTAPENLWLGTISDQWDEPGNWSLGHVPYSIEAARIDGGTVSASTIACTEVMLNAGTLTLTGSLNTPATTVGSGATLVLAGNAGHAITGTLTNHGTIQWLGGSISNDDGPIASQFVNETDGTFEIRSASWMNSVVFTNKGLIRQFGTDYIEASLNGPLHSTGSILVLSGRLNLGQPQFLAGIVNAASGASIECYAGMTPTMIDPAARFEGDGTIRLSGDFTGTLTGKASFSYRIGGNLTIAPGSIITIGEVGTVGGSFQLVGTLTNHGTIRWLSGSISNDDGPIAAQFVNETDGTFEIQCASWMNSVVFTNKGLIRQFGTDYIEASLNGPLHSTGSILVLSGRLNLGQPQFLAGIVNAAAGASIECYAGMTPTMIDPAARFEGNGQIRLSGDFTGTLTGKARFSYRIGGNLTIAPGSIITIGEVGTVGGSFQLVGTLTNHGTIRWLSGSISNDDGLIAAQFVNETDGTFEIQCASWMNSVVFTNRGLIRQFGTDYIEASLNGPLHSTGSILVLSGRLNLGQPQFLAGIVNAASGASIECYAGMTPTMIDPAARFEGDGTIRLSGDFTGTLTGKARFSYRIGGNLTIAPGSIITIGEVGTVGGSFQLVGTLTNHGTIRWLSGSISNDDGLIAAQFVNETDGTFEIQCASWINSVVFTNRGLIRQFGPDYIEANLNGPLHSTGSILVLSGRLNLGQPQFLAGIVNAASGASIECYAGMTPTMIDPAARFEGDGTIRLSGDFTGTLTGKARFAGRIGGGLTIAPGSIITIGEVGTVGGSFQLVGTLTNHGTILWLSGSISNNDDDSGTGHIINAADGIFDIQCDSSLGNTVNFDNQGLLSKSVGGDTTAFTSGITNSGRIDINTGVLFFTGDLEQTAGSIRLNGGNIIVNDPAQLRLLGGELVGSGTITGDVVLEAGTLRPGNATGDALQITGNLTLGPGATIAAAASSAAPTDFGRLVVTGNTTLAGNLAFSLADGFIPATGDRFRFLESTTLTGAFGLSTFPTLPAGTDYLVRYGAGFADVVVGVTSLADWKALHFGTETDPAIVGDDADPDGDGVPNLLEYAFGLEPFTSSHAGLPTTTLQPATPGGPLYLTLTFTTPATVTDLDFIPQVSGNLSEWLSGPGQTDIVSDVTTGGIRTMVVRDTVTVSSGTRRFMRLQVALKP